MLGDIPKARTLIDDAIRFIRLIGEPGASGATALAIGTLKRAKALTFRDRTPRSKGRNVKMTPALGDEVRRLHRKHPDWTVDQISAHLGINNGRVHEALHYGWW